MGPENRKQPHFGAAPAAEVSGGTKITRFLPRNSPRADTWLAALGWAPEAGLSKNFSNWGFPAQNWDEFPHFGLSWPKNLKKILVFWKKLGKRGKNPSDRCLNGKNNNQHPILMNFSVKKQELCIICTKLSRKGKESSSWGHNAPQNESNTHVLGQRRHIEPNASTFGAKIARKGQKMPLLRSRGDETLYLEERWSEMGKYFYFWSLNAQNRQKNVCIWGPNGQRGKRIPIFGKFFKTKFPSLSPNSIL